MVGIGLNVSWPAMPTTRATATPARAGSPRCGVATALNWLGAEVDRVDLLVAFLRPSTTATRALVAAGARRPAGRWRQRSATLGRRVRVDLGADDVEGTAVDVTAEGHLVVETAEGDRRTLAVGDVVHLRPA